MRIANAWCLPGSGRGAVCPQESAHVALGQGKPVFALFPGVEAHLRARCKQSRLHSDGIRMSRDVIRQDQNGLALRRSIAMQRYVPLNTSIASKGALSAK
jgi:hypothetical protein